MYTINNIFKVGDIVCTKVKPKIALVVRLFAYNIYYCIVKGQPKGTDLVYFERELQLFDSKKK